MVRFWIVDSDGNVRLSPRTGPAASLNSNELKQATSGKTVTTFRRRGPSRAILPISRADGKMDFLVLERTPPPRRRLPGFPLLTSLLIAGGMIAILVLPLSLRLTRPLRELHLLGREWSEGNLEKRSAASGTDEISELANVYNTMAANLNRMLQQRKEFLALISHELKSPLARMRIALELLLERGSSAEQRADLIRQMEAEINESEKLIEQLLVVSRIEMNHINFSLIDPVELIKKTIHQVQPLATNKNVQIRFRNNAAGHSVQGDEVHLQRAIGNVLENAIKFSPPSAEIVLDLTAENESVVIRCSDSGSGIHIEDRERIFEPFFRGKEVQGKEGSGLGLFIARRIIELHRGTIAAVPRQPSGVTITIELPSPTSVNAAANLPAASAGSRNN